VFELRRCPADVVVSWPSPFRDFTLQQNTDGIATTNWSNVTASIQDDGTNCAVAITLPR